MELLITFIVVIISIALVLLVLLKNYKSASNLCFAILIFFLGMYPIFNYLTLHSNSSELSFFWAKFILLSAIPAGPLFFLFVYLFPSVKLRINKKVFVPMFIWTSANVMLALTNNIFRSVIIENASPKIEPGPAVASFGLLQILSILGGSFFLIWKYRHSKGLLRLQLQYITYGIIVSFVLVITSTLILPLLFGITVFIPLSPLFLLIAPITIVFSIFRHQLLDIRLLVMRTVTYAIVIFLIAVLYSVIVLTLGKEFIKLSLTINQSAFLVLFIVLIVFSFQGIRKIIEKSTNRFLFKDSYNTDEEIGRLTKIMASTLLLKDLLDRLLPELKKSIKFAFAAFIVPNKDGIFEILTTDEKSALQFTPDESDKIKALQSMVVFDELEESDLKQLMRSHELSIISPCRNQNEIIAYLCLGTKESGDNYTEQDLSFVRILSDEVAVGIKNAQAYEEIKRFNVTLQEEVEKATKQLTEANVQLQELDKLKDEFVSLASHELRTPMAAIKGSISTILEGYAGDISEQTRDFLTAAYNENDRLIRLVNNLLNTSRIESGKLTFSFARIDMNKVIAEVVRNLDVGAKEKKIYLTHEVSGFLPHVMADEDKIKEVIINLVGNAIKFTSTGGITVRSKLENDMVIISVTDTGTGIHNEHFDLLFKKFSQVKTDYTKQYGGTGLGLYISRKIIEGHGGKIWLESEVGKGTTFSFTLPVAK